MRRFVTVAMTFGILLAGFSLAAQENKPSPELAVLKDAEGAWDATIKSQGAESKGTQVSKLALNGNWLIDDFKADFGGVPFEGRGATAYDAAKKKYVNVWIDSMTSSPIVSEGTYNGATKTLTLVGTMPTPDGKTAKVTQTTVTKDSNTRIFTLKTVGEDGKEMEMMQVTYKRRTK